MTREIAGAIILLLRLRCCHVEAASLSTSTKKSDEFTLSCAIKYAHHECSTDCFILRKGLCPIGITEDQLRMDQIKRLLPKNNLS